MGKVAILALTYGRPDMTRETWRNNLRKAGCDYDLYWFDNGSGEEDMLELIDIAHTYDIEWFNWSPTNEGIAKALNKMIDMAFARGAEYVVTMANDIVEPDNWLQMRIDAAELITNTGVVAIPVEDSMRYSITKIHDINVDGGRVIGNYLITKQAYEKVGVFCVDYDPYGPIDLDYCDRCKLMDLRTYYLSDYKANHLGFDRNNNPAEYEQDKKQSLNKHWVTYRRNQVNYSKGVNVYQCTETK